MITLLVVGTGVVRVNAWDKANVGFLPLNGSISTNLGVCCWYKHTILVNVDSIRSLGVERNLDLACVWGIREVELGLEWESRREEVVVVFSAGNSGVNSHQSNRASVTDTARVITWTVDNVNVTVRADCERSESTIGVILVHHFVDNVVVLETTCSWTEPTRSIGAILACIVTNNASF